MGGWLPRSLHHLERARHVCNGLSYASLQTVFSLRKLHKDLDGRRLDKRSFPIPYWSGGLFANRCSGSMRRLKALEDKHAHMSTLEHMHKGETQRQSLFAVSLHCLAFVDFSVRLTITIGQTKLPVV